MSDHLDDSQIKDWRSIITLIVFVVTNVAVLFPFHVPIFIPRSLWSGFWNTLIALRVTPPRQGNRRTTSLLRLHFVRRNFPINFVTAPLIADLFLLAILAISRQEVHDGTLGSDGIVPIDIMAFFLTLAYIAISIDASGIIRWLAFKVLQKAGKNGRRLYLYLYMFFFALASFIGNDPIVLSGTAFLAYMTRVASNIETPEAWIHTQFAIANIGSAILVSSNPTNLVLAGAFGIKFIVYTANIIVPVVVTVIILYPFLRYNVFRGKGKIPKSIDMHQLDLKDQQKEAVNPNIPNAAYTRGDAAKDSEQEKTLSLEEIMNPFLDKKGAGFGAFIMATTLITILALNAASQSTGEHPVYWVTLPAAGVMFCWDVASGWLDREKTRKVARDGRDKRHEFEAAKRQAAEEHEKRDAEEQQTSAPPSERLGKGADEQISSHSSHVVSGLPSDSDQDVETGTKAVETVGQRSTLVSVIRDAYTWSQETFPTVTAVLTHLPWALVPFALAMFVLVQALATKGWITVFAHGWDHWVTKTGTVGAIGGMGFISVVMCNFAGTNIGTTILLCRVIQQWETIRRDNGFIITERTFWATVYSMALGVNYGAFSTAFSASLAGLLWRDILARKHIHVKASDFARVNLKIIAVAMAVGCAVLTGEVYIVRGKSAYKPSQ